MVAVDCAFIALGSNLGDRVRHFQHARMALEETPDTVIVAASRIYETDPIGPAGQDPYLNAVLAVETGLSPRAMLARLLEIEGEAGRVRTRDAERWGPRPLDLDLLLFGDRCLAEKGLELPHPRLHQRAFVLEPLCELAGERIHPRLGEPLEVFRRQCADPAAVRPFSRPSGEWAVAPLHPVAVCD